MTMFVIWRLSSSPNIIKVSKSMRMRQEEKVARHGINEKCNEKCNCKIQGV
jgi:hypothetical protein